MKSLINRYAKLLAEVDRWFALCQSRFPNAIACGRGCSSCCRGLFDITLPDAALLRTGFNLLPLAGRKEITEQAASRIETLRTVFPEFAPPFLLTGLPEEVCSRIMHEEDETPCVLLDAAGLCLLYDYRPLTCRLHGLPLVDYSGEVMEEASCPLNFPDQYPLGVTGLRSGFGELFRRETLLIAEFAAHTTGVATTQFDTLIPAALLVDWSRTCADDMAA